MYIVGNILKFQKLMETFYEYIAYYAQYFEFHRRCNELRVGCNVRVSNKLENLY